MTAAAIPNTVQSAAAGARTLATLIAMSGALTLAAPLVLRITKSTKLAAHWLVISIALSLSLSIGQSAGLDSPGLIWWVTVPIFGMMLLGARIGVIWSLLIVAQLGLLFALKKHGIAVPNDAAAMNRDDSIFGASMTALVAVTLLAWQYESLKNTMLAEVGAARASAERAHESARLVLDNVDQGLLVADASGRIAMERSRAVFEWFGPLPVGITVFELFGPIDARFGAYLRVGWRDFFEDVLPLELVEQQLPSKFVYEGRHFSVSYRPIGAPGKVSSVLLVISDVSELVAAERAEAHQRELLSVFQRVVHDRSVFLEFMEESRERVADLVEGRLDRTEQMRELHTLKGNAGIFGLTETSRFCHELEEKMLFANEQLAEEQRIALLAHWEQVEHRIAPILGEHESFIELSVQEYQDTMIAVGRGEPSSALMSRMRGWTYEPTQRRLAIFAEQARSLSQRLGKGDVSVRIDDGAVRLPRGYLADFWTSMGHLVRNAVDHGLEDKEERRVASKSEVGQIELCTRIERGELVVEVADDGRGIDWTKVAERARALGLPHRTAEDLEAVLFVDGVSTSQDVTDVSGRGVGMAAVRKAVLALGGRIEIRTSRGMGTRFLCLFPLGQLRPSLTPGTVAA